MRDRRSGRGSTEKSRTCEKGDSSGRFLAKLVLLMEDVQLIGCVTFAPE
jgi:hypothetical protein